MTKQMTRLAFVLLTAATLAAPACSKKDGGAGGATSGAKASDDKPAGGAAMKLAKLDNLSIEAGDSQVSDGMSANSAMLIGGDVGAMTVEAVATPRSEADVKAEADSFNPKNYKVEKLPDGYVVTYDNTGSMGATYFVDSQRAIGGKTYHCTTAVSKADQQAAAIAACKSLKK